LQVLERLGYCVIVPHGRVPALRPLIDFCMLALAKREIPTVLQQLRPYLIEGLPVVGLEPSTVAVFRDEMPNLLLHDIDVQRLSQKAYLRSEFLDQEDVELPSLHRQAVLHNHCHQKAVLKAQAMANVLNKIGVHANGMPILLLRQGERIYALGETCAHLGGPLAEGTLDGTSVVCPWHGSRYALEDGRVLDGPSAHAQPSFEVRVRNGQIEVRAADH
jgi:nitrite reductase/ring-hydroxylating ferredoxin subunit